MKASIRPIIFFLASAVTPLAQATMSVNSMNYPAWVQRGGETLPLAPGDQLRAGDQLRTGASGRLWLEVEDGSVIKLGQQSRFTVKQSEFRGTADDTILEAAFDVLKGAFRFTSNFFAARRDARHQVEFQIGAVTAGVRGTDIWGRSGDGEDFVALLEGSIEVNSAGDAAQMMDKPLTLYLKQEGQASTGVQPVDISVIQSLAPDTELDSAAGIATINGPRGLVLMSLKTEAYVAKNLGRFRDAGYAVVAVPAGDFTRIMLTGLVDREAAANLRNIIQQQFAINDAWIPARG